MTTTHAELSRNLKLFDITMIGVGAMIGAGIFVLTGIAAAAAGPALILAFALNGIVTVFTAMVYAELGSSIPEAGGGYLWVKEGLPGPNAFLAGWMSWFAHAVAGSLYALGFGSYAGLVLSQLNVSIGPLHGDLLHKILAALIVVLFAYINYRGSSETGRAGNIVTVAKIVVLGIFIVSGLVVIVRHPIYMHKFTDFTPHGFGGILSAMGLTFIAFEGYEIIVQAGEEVEDPRRTIPRAVFLSLAIVVPIYMLVAFVAIGAVNPGSHIETYQWLGQHAELGIAEAARQFMPFGTILLLLGGLLATMSALNATTYSSTRVSFAMGRDRNLPDLFAHVHPRTRTPHMALVFSGALILFMAVAIPIRDVAAAADIMFLLLFLQVNIAVITIRKKYGDRLTYGYLMPFFPIVPIVGIVSKLFLAVYMFHYSPLAWYVALGWMAAGAAFYQLYARPREAAKTRTPVLFEEKRSVAQETDGHYRVLVPIANPASAADLLAAAVRAVRDRQGTITLLHVIAVPDQLPLSAGAAYLDQAKRLLDEVVSRIDAGGAAVEAIVRIAHRPHQAILQTAVEKRARLLIMGWRGARSARETLIGRNIDRIVEDVTCDVLVLQQTPAAEASRVLVPIAMSGHAAAALLAASLALTTDDGRIDVLHVFPPDSENARRDRIREQLQTQIRQFRTAHPAWQGVIELHTVVAADPVDSILAAAAEADRIVLGATRDSWLKRTFFDDKPTRIAAAARQPVVLFRPTGGQVRYRTRSVLNYLRGGYRQVDPEAERTLVEQGILKGQAPPPQEGLHTAVNTSQLRGIALLAVGSVIAMYIGAGRLWTWIGTVLFLLALGLFTHVSTGGVLSRRAEPAARSGDSSGSD